MNSLDLLHYLERRVTTRDDAADILGDVALTVWTKVHSLPTEPEAARMWLFGIARFTLLNERRRTQRGQQLSANLRAVIHVDSQRQTADDDDRVRDAINGLPADLSEIVRLVHWDGFSIPEAAQLVDTSISTARRRYERAISDLRATLLSKDSARL